MENISAEITGVTVCYNTKDLIKCAYESIRKFHPKMSIIIIDGSPDGSDCREYVKSISQGKTYSILPNYNIGHGRGLVAGLSQVKTPYALIFDSDIEMLKSPLQAMFNMMEEDTYGVGYTEKTDLGGHDFGARPEQMKYGSMKYLHPYFCLIQLKEYKKYSPFIHHGAPAVNICLDIHRRGLSDTVIKEFPGLGHSAGHPIGNVDTWKSGPREFIKHDRDGTRIDIQGDWDKVLKRKTITCITPTGDRPEAFELTRKWIESQTVKPDQWLVIDDGKTPLPKYLQEGVEYVRRIPKSNEGHTLTLNMKTALPYIKGDIILIIEDDDWYGPNYIATMEKYLQTYDLVGEGCARYYYLPDTKYERILNREHASFCQTGFTRKILPIFEKCIAGNPYIDMRLWRTVTENKYLMIDTEDKLKLHCSLKGMKGRKGIGTGHSPNFHKYQTDIGLKYLTAWVGKENAQIYMEHISSFKREVEQKTDVFPSFKKEGVTVITCTGDRPESFNLLRRWMINQTEVPSQWIVVDDGKEALSDTSGFEYIRREPEKNDYTHTLCLNLLKALAAVKNDKIIIMEDDDWYSPVYIEYMSKLLDKADLVGLGNLIFYYPSELKYMEKKTVKQPAFGQTAFHSKIIPILQNICKHTNASTEFILCGKGLVDDKLWKDPLQISEKVECARLGVSLKTSNGKILPKGMVFKKDIPLAIQKRVSRGDAEIFYEQESVKVEKLTYICEEYITVGMKGMPGRKGLTTHHIRTNPRYKLDNEGKLLKSILKEDAKFYLELFS